MGSGIAQKMATEGFAVTLVDLDDEKVARGMSIIEKTLNDGVQRGIFSPPEAAAILQRVTGTSRFEDLGDVDLVVEAVFEDLEIKKTVFRRLDEVCRPDAILATNTSSYAVTELASATTRPQRVVGLHYFYHPAKNRLVEVVSGQATDPAAHRRAWRLQEALGKTPIASSDSYGFIVNRFFLPWLTEAVRMLEEGAASTATIDEAAKKAFGIGMGPFELMNVTGVPIAFHAATTLGRAFGPMYESPALLRAQMESGQAVGHHRDAGRRPVHGRRRSTGHRCVLRRGRARRRARRHDRRHRHRRARGAAVAARPVRADESLRHRARQRSRRRFRRALEPADAGHARRSGSQRARRSASRWSDRTSPMASPR